MRVVESVTQRKGKEMDGRPYDRRKIPTGTSLRVLPVFVESLFVRRKKSRVLFLTQKRGREDLLQDSESHQVPPRPPIRLD